MKLLSLKPLEEPHGWAISLQNEDEKVGLKTIKKVPIIDRFYDFLLEQANIISTNLNGVEVVEGRTYFKFKPAKKSVLFEICFDNVEDVGNSTRIYKDLELRAYKEEISYYEQLLEHRNNEERAEIQGKINVFLALSEVEKAHQNLNTEEVLMAALF